MMRIRVRGGVGFDDGDVIPSMIVMKPSSRQHRPVISSAHCPRRSAIPERPSATLRPGPASRDATRASACRGGSHVRHRGAPTMPPMSASAARPILVVDDDAKIVRLVRTYLERAGYRVVEAGD